MCRRPMDRRDGSQREPEREPLTTIAARDVVEPNARATWPRRVLRYSLPFVAVGAASGLTYLLDLAIPVGQNLFLFFAAVVVTAWYAGAGPGWLAVALSAFAVDFFFLPPVFVLNLGAKEAL